MEIKEEYKKTEVGLIPQEWDCVELGTITSKIGSGITPTGGSRSYKSTGRPFVRSQNVLYGKMNLEDIAYIDEETHKTFEGTEIHFDDVLLNITGASIGRSSVADVTIVGGNVNQHVCILRPIKGMVNSLYLCSYILSSKGQKYIDDFQSGGNRQGLNFKQISSIKLPIPPVPEQQAIATALSDIDGLISSLVKLIDKKKNIKYGAMQELLTGKKRLTGFSGNCVKKTEIGIIPEDWDCVQLGSIGESIIGLTYKPSDVRSNGKLVLRSSNIDENKLVFTDNVYVDMEVSERLIVRENDILICVRNGSRNLIGKCALINKKTSGQTFGAFMSVFRSNYGRYLFNCFQSNIVKKQISGNMGATINQITNKDLNSFYVPLPTSEDEQKAIADVLSDMDNEIKVLEQKLNKYKEIRQGMMQELLTGRIRLEKTIIEEKLIVEASKSEKHKKSGHTKEFDEAVVISAIVSRFATESFPIGAFKRQKLAYLLHRHHENKAEGYEKFAAGPYNYHTKYGGAEKIAQSNKYIREHTRDRIKGFVAAEKSQQALDYFYEWYGSEVLEWLEQFRYCKNEELELLTTVDMAMVELKQNKKTVSVSAVKFIIQNSAEWKAKLNRAIFSDVNIKRAIEHSNQLFDN